MRELRSIKTKLLKQPDEQLSLTDPDARSMATSGRGTGIVGYNVQVVADAKHHLIVAHDVVNVGNDRAQLWSMAQKAREAIGDKKLRVIADRGYFKGPEILACEQAGIATLCSQADDLQQQGRGALQQARLRLHRQGRRIPLPGWTAPRVPSQRHRTRHEDQRLLDQRLPGCPLKAQCTTGDERRVRRWEHEAVLDLMQARLDRKPHAMKIRRRTVEHVFGTLKHWMGSTHFLMKTLEHVGTEMSLHALAYNLKRVISVLGIARTLKAVQMAGA